MSGWITSLVRGRTLDVAIAVGLGYAIAELADEVVTVPVRVLAQHFGAHSRSVDDLLGLYSAGVYLLNFRIGGTVIFYGEVVAASLSLAFVALFAWLVVRMRDRMLGECPFCASRIPYKSSHCAYCGLGVKPAES